MKFEDDIDKAIVDEIRNRINYHLDRAKKLEQALAVLVGEEPAITPENVARKETPTVSANPGAIRPSSTPQADARKKVAIPDNHYPVEWEIILKDKEVVKLYKVVTTVNGNHIDVSKGGVNQQTIPLGSRDNAYTKIKQMTYNQAYAGHTVNILRTAHKNALYEN